MKISKISYKNLNGLTNEFDISNKLNVFIGSNGCGKTTTLDAIALMLFGESFSYGKQIEKHIDYKTKSLVEVHMEIFSDKNVIDEMGKEQKIAYNFDLKMGYDEEGAFETKWLLNGKKATFKAYRKFMCGIFGIEEKYLEIKDFNVFRILIDPSAIRTASDNSLYEFIKKLTGVSSVEEFSNSKEDYASIRPFLAQNNYDIDETRLALKTIIKNNENAINSNNILIDNNDKKINEENKLIIAKEEFDKKINKYNELVDKIEECKANDEKMKKEFENASTKNRQEVLSKITELDKNITENVSKKNQLIQKTYDLSNVINSDKSLIDYQQNEINKLKEEQVELSNMEFGEIICPECHCVINKDDEDKFNEQKEEQLKINLEQIEKIETEIKKYSEERKAVYDKLSEINNDIQLLNKQISENTNTKTELNEKLYSLQPSEEMNNITIRINNNAENGNKLIEEINALMVEINTYNNHSDNIARYEADNTKIGKQLDEIETLKCANEQRLLLVEQFKTDYSHLVSSMVSKVFGDINFNMLKTGKTSGKEKINCYALDDDKPIYNFNTAPQIAFGCKIINQLKKHLGIKGLPIMFDIVDNIGEKSLNNIMDYCKDQLFCTRATFDEHNELCLVNKIEDLR